MKNFDESYKQVYFDVMYPRTSGLRQMTEPASLRVPPEQRAEENRMREANLALSGMAVADVAAGALKGAVQGAVGAPGDVVGILRGLYEIGARGGDESAVDAFMRGLQEGFILPTSEDVGKWLDENVGPVVPKGGELDQVQQFREQRAAAGELAGEVLAPGGLVAGAVKATKAGARATKSAVRKSKQGQVNGD